MRKSLSAAMIMGLAGVLITGCNTGNSGEGAYEKGKKKVNVSIWTLDSNWEWVDKAIKDFEHEHPYINVELSKFGTDPLKENLKVAANTKTLPDMWFTWGGSLGSFYPENGLTMDLTQVAKEHRWEEKYNQASIEMSTFGGKVSGIPMRMNVLSMWYPKSVYEQAKLKPPTTFEEFEAQLQTLKDSGITPLSFGNRGGWHTIRLTEQLIEHYGGPELHDRLMSLSASWNNPAVVKTFGKLKEYTDKGYFPKGYISLSPQEANTMFYQKKAGLIAEGTSFDRNLNSMGIDVHEFGIFTFPTGHKPARASVFAEMLQINGESEPEEQEAAIKLGEYLTGTDVVNKYIESYGAPAALNVRFSDKMPHMEELLESAQEGTFLIMDQALPQQLVQKVFEAQDRVALGEWTPQQAAVEMENAVNDYKSKRK